MGLILKTIVVVLGCLAAADIAGAIVCTIVDILPLKYASQALAYAIWLVIGGFCGLIAYNFAGAWSSPKGGAGDWSTRPGATRIGTGVLLVGAVVVLGLAGLFYEIIWTQSFASDDYVPDSESHSIVFFVAVVGAMALGRFMFMSKPEPAPGGEIVGE